MYGAPPGVLLDHISRRDSSEYFRHDHHHPPLSAAATCVHNLHLARFAITNVGVTPAMIQHLHHGLPQATTSGTIRYSRHDLYVYDVTRAMTWHGYNRLRSPQSAMIATIYHLHGLPRAMICHDPTSPRCNRSHDLAWGYDLPRPAISTTCHGPWSATSTR